MDLWQLHIFCHVKEKGSFSRAAEAVHLTQPTVSAHIKELEDHFGCRLMDRLGRRAVATPAGELLYAHAKKLLAAREEAESAVHAFLGHPRGRLSVGGSTIPGNYVLPGMIGPFVKQYPEVSVSLTVADTREVARQTVEGLLELSVVGALVPDRNLTHETFLDDELVLVVPPGHPFAGKRSVSVKELAVEPFILREEGSGTRRTLSDMLKAAGVDLSSLTVAAEMGSTEAVRQGVMAGLGVSILSRRAVALELAAGVLAEASVRGLPAKRTFLLIRHARRTPSPLGAAFHEFLVRSARELPVPAE